MKTKQLFIGTFLLATVAAFTVPVFAQETQCQPIYGGGQTCVQTGNVTIDKKVKKANTNDYVDNIQASDPQVSKYAPDSTVSFQLRVKNTSNRAIEKVVLKDILPEELTFVSGSGTYVPTNRTFTREFAKLEPNQEQVTTIQARVASRDKLPRPCFINQATVTAENKTNQDNAQVCIQTVEPTTGPGTPTPTQSGPTPTLRPGQPTPTTIPGQPTGQPGEPKGGQPGTTTQGGQPQGGTQPGQTGTNPTGGTQPGGQPTETKGGLKVFPSPQVEQTPKTGPEMLALAGLLPAGALGHFLRRKTNFK